MGVGGRWVGLVDLSDSATNLCYLINVQCFILLGKCSVCILIGYAAVATPLTNSNKTY